MDRIEVTITIQRLGELVSEYNRHTRAPLRAVVDAVKQKEGCIEIVGHTGATQEITTGKELVALLKRVSAQSRVQLTRKITCQKNK